MKEYKEISIDQIDVPENRVRKTLSEAELEDLAQSIREYGVLEPLLVRRKNERYEVVAGVRRLWACRMCGRVMIPCMVVDGLDVEYQGMELVENMVREDVNVVEEAEGIAGLVRAHDGNIEETAKLLRKSAEYIKGRLAVLSWPDEVKDSVQKGQISLSVARELVRCDNDRIRLGFLDSAVKGGCTARTMAGWVADWRASQGEQISRSAAEIIQDHTSPPPKVVVKCQACGREIQDGDLRTLILCSECYGAIKKEIEKE